MIATGMSDDDRRKDSDDSNYRLTRIEKLLVELLANMSGCGEDLYSVKAAAAFLECSRFTVREKCCSGELQAKRTPDGAGGKGEWRITRAELERAKREGWRRQTEQGF